MNLEELSMDLFSDNDNHGGIVSDVYERIRAFSLTSSKYCLSENEINKTKESGKNVNDSNNDDDDNNNDDDDILNRTSFVERFKSFTEDFKKFNNSNNHNCKDEANHGCECDVYINDENSNMNILNSLSFSSALSASTEQDNENSILRKRTLNDIKCLFDNNKKWVESVTLEKPGYFSDISKQKSPKYLWIGCSDSRVPANVITNTQPGDIFVHRNIANMVIHSDMNVLSVLSYAVEILKVKHVIVCGHYECGGIKAALSNKQYGLIDYWLKQIKDVYKNHQSELDSIPEEEERLKHLVELNVKEQVRSVCNTAIVQNAWADKTRTLYVHGWVYDIHDGIIHDLETTFSNNEQLHKVYKFSM